MAILLNLLLSAIVVMVAAYIVPGVTVTSFGTALVVAVVLGLLNAVLKPILILLTLPITILTLGLFTIVINIGLLFLASELVPGFTIDSLLGAILFGLLMSLITTVLGTAK
ncbi:MAG: phage holin family protein [Microgenomates group bacterium]